MRMAQLCSPREGRSGRHGTATAKASEPEPARQIHEHHQAGGQERWEGPERDAGPGHAGPWRVGGGRMEAGPVGTKGIVNAGLVYRLQHSLYLRVPYLPQ